MNWKLEPDSLQTTKPSPSYFRTIDENVIIFASSERAKDDVHTYEQIQHVSTMDSPTFPSYIIDQI